MLILHASNRDQLGVHFADCRGLRRLLISGGLLHRQRFNWPYKIGNMDTAVPDTASSEWIPRKDSKMSHSSPGPMANGLRQLVCDLSSQPAIPAEGLSDVICGQTELIGFPSERVNYCGVDLAELVSEGSFESVMWLLLNRCEANPEQLADTCSILNDSAIVDHPAAETVATIPLQTRPLDLFPLTISLLACFDPTPSDSTLEASKSRFWRVMSQMPVLFHVAFGGKLHDGKAFDQNKDGGLSFAGQLLQILRQDDVTPSPQEEQAMNAVLICECLTEMRPACFSARVFGSSVNDIVAGLKSASSMFVSQLRNDPFAWMSSRMRSFTSPDHAQSWWSSRKSKTMPYGFQADDEDYRANLLRLECRAILGNIESIVMESSCERLESILAAQGYFPTTDWTATRALTILNVPEDRISLAIGIARMVGWAAQTVEQHESGVSLLPSLSYGAVTE